MDRVGHVVDQLHDTERIRGSPRFLFLLILRPRLILGWHPPRIENHLFDGPFAGWRRPLLHAHRNRIRANLLLVAIHEQLALREVHFQAEIRRRWWRLRWWRGGLLLL